LTAEEGLELCGLGLGFVGSGLKLRDCGLAAGPNMDEHQHLVAGFVGDPIAPFFHSDGCTIIGAQGDPNDAGLCRTFGTHGFTRRGRGHQEIADGDRTTF